MGVMSTVRTGFGGRETRMRRPVAIVLAFLAIWGLVESTDAQTEVVTETYEDGSIRVQRTVRELADGTLVNHGPYESYHETGKLASRGEYRDGKREGEWEFRWPSGRRRERGEYVEGRRHGEWTGWHETGGRSYVGSYELGHRTGEWRVLRADRSIDERRSGVYDFVEGGSSDGTHGYRGALLNGVKDGPWLTTWPGGAPMLALLYDAGRVEEVVFSHRDGCIDLEWVSGRYRAGEWVAPAEELPEWISELDLEPEGAGLPRAAWPAAAGTVELLDEVLGEDPLRAELALEQLLALRREALPAAVNRLVACDLERAEEREVARRVHEEVLAPIVGGNAWPWPVADDAQALARAHRIVDRWDSAWPFLGDDERAWAEDFAEDHRWLELDPEDTALGRPRLPDFVLASAPGSDAAPGAGAIGLGAGPRFRKTLRKVAGRAGETLLVNALERVRDAQARDGSWRSANGRSTVRATSLALLALIGDGSTLSNGPFRESVFRGARWLVELQDPSTGRIGTGAEADPLHAHALATHVLVELVGSGERRVPRAPGRRAVDRLSSCALADGSCPAHTGRGGGDVRTTCAAIVALVGAANAGLDVDADVVRAAGEWLLRQSETVEQAGDAGDAAAVHLAASVAGLDAPGSERLQRLADLLRRSPPSRDTPAEVLFLGGRAAHRAGGATWRSWEEPLVETFQARAPGALDLEETALLVLALEVHAGRSLVLGER